MTGFLTLIDRELTRFVRLSRQTVAPPVITTVMFILIFGYSLGSRIREIEGFSYILFILPGLIQMGVVMNSYANSSTSLFMARLERSVENLLVAPLNYFEIVSAYIIGGMLRGIVVGLTIIICSSFFISFPFHSWPALIAALIFPSILFAGLGIVSALYAETWDKIALFTNFIITPFVYLGGVFYSIKMLPGFWQNISYLNPIFYCVDLTRYGFLGYSDAPLALSITVVISFSIMVYALCVYLFWKGYKIVS